MEDYKPNSHRFREEQEQPQERKKVEKVVTGTVKTKKNDARKLANIFISEDIKNVKSYLLMDLLVPALKDSIVKGITMLLFGNSARSTKSTNATRVSYRNYYDQRDNDRRESNQSRGRFDYDDLVFETRDEALAVRSQMEDIIERYGYVTVLDLYDMVELTAPFTANKYGWLSIRNADVSRISTGYVLKLPRAVPID